MSDKPITCTERAEWAKALKYAQLEADITHRRLEKARKEAQERRLDLLCAIAIVTVAVLLACFVLEPFANAMEWYIR